ncbi:MAG: c-type cytochrome [Actinomycetota bacterium]|nr:c-type cytochrome [Actinomycetota bacterium]
MLSRLPFRKILAVGAVGLGGGLFGALMPAVGAPAAPAQVQGDTGRFLYMQDCAWCHGGTAEGTDRGPPLEGTGAASTHFMLITGRMPIPAQVDNPERRAPSYSPDEIAAIVDYVSSLVTGPGIPTVDPEAGDVSVGLTLYEQNCAACHGSTGTGGAMTQGLLAPSVLRSTPVEVAEAMRLGGAGLYSGNMPRFGPERFDDHDVNSIAAYINFLQVGGDRGGLGLGRIGPVAEGFVAWAVGLLALIVVIAWIGGRE